MRIKRYLIVRSDGDCRIVSRRPSLGWNEVAFELNVVIPETWATIKGSVDIVMPEPPDALLEVQVVEPYTGNESG